MKKKISFAVVFNIIVIALSIGLITYFCVSEDGLIDLISSDISLNALWVVLAVLCQLGNMFIDSVVTYMYIKGDYSSFTFLDGVKSSCVGSFFSAITPSSTGGQPMQVIFMANKKIDAGFATSCMTQKFVVFQITSTAFSVFALIFKFDFFISHVNTPVLWAFVIAGFFSQVVVTGLFIFISFNRRFSNWVVRVCSKLIRKIKLIKNPEKYIKSITDQVEVFHDGNKALMSKPKLMVKSYLLVFVQVLLMMLVPYCIYRAFGLNGASPVDMVCSQAFVTLASAMIPLPGATGAAELAFSVFYKMFYGSAILKSALLLWRVITYYGVILICAPFSILTKKEEDEKAVRADTAQQENYTAQGDTESLEDLEDTESTDDESCESSGEFLDIQQVQDEI